MQSTVMTIAPDTFEAWVANGRDLAASRRNVDWQLADWMIEGQDKGYLTQASFDFLTDNLGIPQKRLKDITKAATAFPAHLRDASLTIEHHAAVAAVPTQEALQLLHTARDNHWSPEQTRHEARRGHVADDVGNRSVDELESFLRHWNRLPRPIRIEAAEMIATSNGDLIEP